MMCCDLKPSTGVVFCWRAARGHAELAVQHTSQCALASQPASLQLLLPPRKRAESFHVSEGISTYTRGPSAAFFPTHRLGASREIREEIKVNTDCACKSWQCWNLACTRTAGAGYLLKPNQSYLVFLRHSPLVRYLMK